MRQSEIHHGRGRLNRLHHWLCRSARCRKTVQERVPWALSDADLGQNVLELGPGPGLTTDLLRLTARCITAIEIDSKLSESLKDTLVAGILKWLRGRQLPRRFRMLSFLEEFRSPCFIMSPLQNCRTNYSARCGES